MKATASCAVTFGLVIPSIRIDKPTLSHMLEGQELRMGSGGPTRPQNPWIPHVVYECDAYRLPQGMSTR